MTDDLAVLAATHSDHVLPPRSSRVSPPPHFHNQSCLISSSTQTKPAEWTNIYVYEGADAHDDDLFLYCHHADLNTRVTYHDVSHSDSETSKELQESQPSFATAIDTDMFARDRCPRASFMAITDEQFLDADLERIFAQEHHIPIA